MASEFSKRLASSRIQRHFRSEKKLAVILHFASPEDGFFCRVRSCGIAQRAPLCESSVNLHRDKQNTVFDNIPIVV